MEFREYTRDDRKYEIVGHVHCERADAFVEAILTLEQ